MAASLIFCGHCGAQNLKSENFCFSCGYQLTTSTVVAPVSSTFTGQLPAHTLIKRRYRVLQTLGQGGMGAVYLAQDTQLGDRLVAVKEVGQSSLSGQQTQEAVDNFKREAHILASLQHPNLPSIHDHFEESGRWYLVMSFIQGDTLENCLQQARDQKLSLEETLRIGQTLCSVLNYLHTHQPPIIFRDLKPSNIMCSPEGHIYLIDFGIARHFKPGQARDTANYGSAGYAPPEQYGRAQTTQRSDIYSLGVTLYQLLSGYDPSQLPFRFPPLQSLVPALPAQLVTLITQMLELDESKRPASIKVVQQELQQATLPPLSPARQYPPVSPVPKSFKLFTPLSTPMYQRLPVSQGQTKITNKPTISRRTILIGTLGAAAIAGIFTIIRKQSQQPLQNQSVKEANPTVTPPDPTVTPQKPVFTYRGHKNGVTTISWSPDGKRIASGSMDYTVQVWNANNGSNVFSYRKHLDPVTAVAWSPDGKNIASGSSDKTLQVWNATDGSNVFTVGNLPGLYSIVWSPDGKQIASGAYEMQIWNATDGSNVSTYFGDVYAVKAVAWSPDGKRIAFGDTSGVVQVCNANDWSNICTYRGHERYTEVNVVAWSPDGKRIASCADDDTVQVWNASDGGNAFTYQGHSSSVLAVAWSPDGKRIASGSMDYTVQIWNANNGSNVFTYQGHSDGWVQSVAWSPDGKRIASGGMDYTVQVWYPA